MTADNHANELDREIFRSELDSFVPDNVLDAHAHIWSRSARSPTIPKGFEQFEKEITLEVWRRRMDELLPGRRQGGLMIPLAFGATAEVAQEQNEFASRQALSDPWGRPSMFMPSQMDPDYVRQEARRLNVAGFKCYHTESPRRPTWDSDIPEFLPEEPARAHHFPRRNRILAALSGATVVVEAATRAGRSSPWSTLWTLGVTSMWSPVRSMRPRAAGATR